MDYKRPKGTRDILPKETKIFEFMENKARETAKLNNYQEIKTPTFEEERLFTRSVGESSDIVNKEMYTFEDKAGRKLALRPEGTAGVARAVIENGLLNEALPLKLYYFFNAFRYENTQAGRYREFNQLGLEVFGADTYEADAELILLVKNYLNSLGVNDYKILINSVGCKECRAEYNEALRNFAKNNENNLCADCKRRAEQNPMRILDCKNPDCRKLITKAPKISDYLCNECKNNLSGVCALLDKLGVKYIKDDNLVRGLDYYTKTVFEFITETDGKELTIAGGGRYDNLLEELSGKPCSALGVGIGLDRVLPLIESSTIKNPDLIYLANTDDVDLEIVVVMAEKLRKMGKCVEINLAKRSFGAQMKYASKIKAKFVYILGKNELEKGFVTVKNLETGEQKQEII